VYITSDSKFVRDEYITDGIEVIKATPKLVDAQGLVDRREWKKIVMTNDLELIEDGVQQIGDLFFRWFVLNPTCVKVEVVYGLFNPMGRQVDPNDLGQNHSKCVWKYKIITTKEEQKQPLIDIMRGDEELGIYEEPKQETLEEASLQYRLSTNNKMGIEQMAFESGAKWQQERMYSEEEVIAFGEFIFKNTLLVNVKGVEGILKQFKKK
jgi:hypothetical protein